MRRILLDEGGALAVGARIPLQGGLARYLRGSLRLRSGDGVVIVDTTGAAWEARVEEEALHVTAAARVALAPPSPCRIEVLQALPKGDKMAEIVRRATELGAERIVPVDTERVVARPSGDGAGKLSRWRRVAREAARQSERRGAPEVTEVRSLSDALALAHGDLRLVPWEQSSRQEVAGSGLREVLAQRQSPAGSVSLLVGPEGGLAAGEVDEAVAAGFVSVSLGPRILRTETVALTLCAVLQHLWGDLG